MLLCVTVMFLILPTFHSIYQSRIRFSSAAHEFQPRHSIQLISTTTTRSRTICSATCNKQPTCHTFDYDSASGRCRVFEADETTGSIIPSTSTTSIVGSILISPAHFLPTHNQSCGACQEDRYEYCSVNSSTCKCRPHTFWNGSMCLLRLFENDTCSQIDACRSDLNLSCLAQSGPFSLCISGIRSDVIQTIEPESGPWGTYMNLVYCGVDTWAIGFRQRVEPLVGAGHDDTALNALELLCANKNRTSEKSIISHMGCCGDWGTFVRCSGTNHFLNGVSFRLEPPQGPNKDDTAANDSKFTCTQSSSVIVTSNGGSLGDWQNMTYCPPTTAICGFALKLEVQGNRCGGTSANGAKFVCCAL